MMDDFRKQAIVIGLTKLFSRGFFSICDFNKIAEARGVTPSQELLLSLEPLHCVSYSEMEPEFREELKRRVLVALGAPPELAVEFQRPEPPRRESQEVKVLPPPRSLLQRIFGGA